MLNFISLLNLSFFSHQFILLICTFIVFFVLFIFVYIFFFTTTNTFFNNSVLLELYWTLLPVLFVLLLFLPLFYYGLDFLVDFNFFYFFVGNQWFWDFEFFDGFTSSLSNFEFLFNSYSLLVLPNLSYILFFLTSNDVLHAFSIPILYTMVDLVPGVIHQLSISFPISGLYTVYCSQICGLNHSAMPFVICAL